MINECNKYTMVGKGHLNVLSGIISTLNKNKINGSLVECGIWKGGCIAWMTYCQSRFNAERKIYLYDTFKGMTEPKNEKNGTKSQLYYDEITNNKRCAPWDKWHGENRWAYAPKLFVKDVMDKIPYNKNNISYIEGDICETLNDNNNIPDDIALLRLDTDWYESTKKELDVLFPKVTKGGYVIVDDYYTWQGAKIATDEFLKKNRNIKMVKSDRFMFIKL
jgi:O-methyltransferase